MYTPFSVPMKWCDDGYQWLHLSALKLINSSDLGELEVGNKYLRYFSSLKKLEQWFWISLTHNCALDRIEKVIKYSQGFSGGSHSKESACIVGDPGSTPGLGRSPGEGNGNLLQYSCLENPMDRGAWQSIVHAVTKSQTRLNNFSQALTHLIFLNT